MNKQEAMQVHRTLMATVQEIANTFDTNLGTSDLEQYQELGVRPTDLNKKRADHEEAILKLSDDLANSLEGGDSSEAEEENPIKA